MATARDLRIKYLFAFFILVHVATLYFFYLKYVPIVKDFQFFLIPILFAVFIVAALNISWGTLLFIFAFPLINFLPYFFGIFEDTPHAPTALVLFLFYFLGWLVHYTFTKLESSYRYSVSKPIILFALIVFTSGIITLFRCANFYPFLSNGVYEFTTNVNGVTAGGAIMSTVFFSLNYLTGFAFFFILINTLKSKQFVKRVLVVLLVSTSISVAFGLYQHFSDINFGNTPFRAGQNTINATFKDPLSFGAYLGVLVPLSFGLILALKKMKRVVAILATFGMLFVLPYCGSLSGLLGMLVSLVFLLIFVFKDALNIKRTNPKTFRKIVTSIGLIFFLLVIFVSTFLIVDSSNSIKKLKMRIFFMGEKKDWNSFTGKRLSYFWELAGNMLKDYPLSGVGVGSYIIELPNYAKLHNKESRTTDSAENYFLQVGAELGTIGLLISIWIFWEIFKKIWRGPGQDLLKNGWRFAYIGIKCGIISFFVMFVFHTYIGSYELKYTFWLLIALLFSLGGEEKESSKRTLFNKKNRYIGVILILIFIGSHSWNSTHSLSLKSRSDKFDLKRDFGFYRLERTNEGREFRWTGTNAGIFLTIKNPVVSIPLLASHPDLREKPVKVKIYLVKDFFRSKRLLGEVTLTESMWDIYEFCLPNELNQEVILLIKVSRTWNPLKIIGTPDPRNLGVAVGEIVFSDESGKLQDFYFSD